MSTGMAPEDAIDEAVTTTRKAGCTQKLPAPMDQANLRQIPELAKRFDVFAGLSDHTMGTSVSVASIALGACLIEKHLTFSRANKDPIASSPSN